MEERSDGVPRAASPSDQEEMQEEGNSPQKGGGGGEGGRGGSTCVSDSNSFVTALPYQHLYPTLPDDIFHTPSPNTHTAKSTSSRPSDFTTALQAAASKGDRSEGEGKLHLSDSPGEEFGTPVGLRDKEVLPSTVAARKLTRNSLTRGKQESQGTQLLSPTVPINYAIQQLSEGKKDPATIRKELAEMCSERVDTGQEASVPPGPVRLGKRKVQFAEPSIAKSVFLKRRRDGEESLLQPQGRVGGRKDAHSPPSSSQHPPHSYSGHISPPGSHGRTHSRQSDSWFAKLFRNK